MAGILVLAEHKDGRVRKSSLEAVSASAKVGSLLGEKVTAIVLGSGLPAAEAQALGRCGAAAVWLADDPALAAYSPEGHAKAFSLLAKPQDPTAIFLSSTSQGKDLAPRIAAQLGVGLASDCTELFAEGGRVRARRPVYAGKAYVLVETDARPFMATLRPNVFPVAEVGSPVAVDKKAAGISAADCKSVLKEFHAASGGKIDVAEASVIVSGGRGMKGPEHWKLVEELAAALGAATGASRAVVDAGWRPHEEQVGQTGKTVAPLLYVACGISGAIQHLAGMRTSKIIVAINKDPEAPIFKVADYGIVGDVFQILPPLSKAIREIKAKER